MTIRRWIALALIAALAVTTAPPSSRAQIPMIANGIVMSTVASVNIANTTTEQLMYQYPIPAALLASWTTTNRAFGSAPLHLVLMGTVQSTGAGALTVGVNLQSSTTTASMLAANGAILNTAAAGGPMQLDFWVSPIATLTTTNCTDLKPCTPGLYMRTRLSFQGIAVGATEVVLNGLSLPSAAGITNQATTLNVLGRWSAAASGNTLNIYNGVLKLGY